MEVFIPIAILGGIVLLPVLWLMAIYNRFNRLRQHLRESWSGIEVELQRRYDLIPNLVETVKGYAAHEREMLSEVTQLRNQAAANHGAVKSQSEDELRLEAGLRKLYMVAEAYPDLKASTNFLSLQQELAITEDRIAATRRFYNGNVRDMNQLCDQFPTNLVAQMFGFEKGDYFEAEADAGRVPSAAVS